MGSGTYSCDARSARALTKGYTDESTPLEAIFTQQSARKAHDEMNPMGVSLRECRDSDDHPAAFPVVIGLDMTGSMRHIPRNLISDGLPSMVDNMIQLGIPSPAILFSGIGDHECDSYPLQIGQFESSDELLDMWLTRVYIESGGGGNQGESYHLLPLFVAGACETDEWDKRGNKGVLFTIGDEPTLPQVPVHALEGIFGVEVTQSILAKAGLQADKGRILTKDIVTAVQKRWHWFHINTRDGARGKSAEGGWKKLLGQNLLTVDDSSEVPNLMADTVAKWCFVHDEEETPPSDTPTIDEDSTSNQEDTPDENPKEEEKPVRL